MRNRRFSPSFDACERRLPLDGSVGDGFDSPPVIVQLAGLDDPDGSFGIPSPYGSTPSGPATDDEPIVDPSGYVDPDPSGPIPVAPINAYA